MKTRARSSEAPPARVGRPRAMPVGAQLGSDPKEEILAAAHRLFTIGGYGRTSTRQIADAVGLRQASLYYYFPLKENILEELLDRTVESSLRYVNELEKLDAPPAVKLWLLIVNDLDTLFSPPGNLGWLMYQPEARSESMSPFWEKHDRLLSAYEQIVGLGVESGAFRSDLNSGVSARIIFSMVEGLATAYVAGAPIEPDSTLEGSAAEHALRSVLAEDSALDSVVSAAEDHYKGTEKR